MNCPCKLDEAYLQELTQRIITARKNALMALMPKGVDGGGEDYWYRSKTTHENGWHYDGERIHAVATPGDFSVSADDGARTVTVTFTVTMTQETVATKYLGKCDICGTGGDS